MIYLLYILVLIFTIWLNKEFIDDSAFKPKENNEWHVAQFWQLDNPFTWNYFWTLLKPLIVFGFFYPAIYDIGLNLARGMDSIWHKSKNDVPVFIKIILILTGLVILIN